MTTSSVPDTQRLLATLGQLQELLARSPWRANLETVTEELKHETKRPKALHDLRAYFGGMGSLNDVFLCEENRNLPDGLGRDEANERLGKLLDDLFAQLSPLESESSGGVLPARVRSAFRGGGSSVA